MFQSPEAAAALLSATSEFAVSGPRLSAAAAARVRRSVRAFSDQPVTDEDVRTLLELTSRAPSAFNAQPWRFVVIRDAALKDQLKAAAFNQQQVAGAPVLIAMYADMEDTLANLDEIVNPGLTPAQRDATVTRLTNTWGTMTVADRATWANAQSNIALGYLLLIAQSEGFATSPMLGFKPDEVKALLDIPAHATITALVALGHAAEDGYPSHRLDLDRITEFR
jgi:nitroreductase